MEEKISMELSIIIPAFNEEKRLGSTLDKIRAFMAAKKMGLEVIVVDDGSYDGTSRVARESALAGRLKLLRNRKNTGKGFSVAKGVAEASGRLILLSDADLSTPIGEFDKLKGRIDGGADIAIGSRASALSQVLVRQPLYRQTMGRTFNFIIRFLVGEEFRDTQCGFKLFRKEAAKKIFPELSIKGFAFDVEMLYLARRYGYKVEEVGVRWENSLESKVNPLVSSLPMLRDVIKIRMAHR
ncbi:MAG: dolichyl-phosphate beta-glucosyltransferase [Candidatus Omnitrophota bacterium]